MKWGVIVNDVSAVGEQDLVIRARKRMKGGGWCNVICRDCPVTISASAIEKNQEITVTGKIWAYDRSDDDPYPWVSLEDCRIE